MKLMLSISPDRVSNTRGLCADLLIVFGLVGLDVAARLVPHTPDFTPVAASALFAASALRRRPLALLVPIAALLISDALLGFYDIGVMVAVYGALALPACEAFLPLQWRRAWLLAVLLVSSSLTFYVTTNFAVWAFSGIYPATAAGLLKCYVAALPFLRNMLSGDLFWGSALFGTYWLLQATRVTGGHQQAAARAVAVRAP